MQAVRAQVDDKPRRILYVGAADPSASALELAHVATPGEAVRRLCEERFGILVLAWEAGTPEDARRLATLDPEMFVLVAASDASLARAGQFSNQCGVDGVVRLPLTRQDIGIAVERASRLSSRVAHCVKLYELCRSLFGSLKQRDLVTTVLDVAPRVIPAQNVALFLLSSFCESPAAFECHASEPPMPELRGLLADATSLASERGTVVGSDDVVGGPAASARWRWLGCPLASADGNGGAIVFLRSPVDPAFSPAERRAAATFASTVAAALENARDYRELESKVHRLARDRQRAVAREAIAIARNLGGAVAHEVTNAMTVVASNVDALADAVHDQRLWHVAKEAAEYLILQGEPTGQRLASRLIDAGGARGTDGLVTEIAGMIDECLEGVRRVSEMARGLTGQALPPMTPPTHLDPRELVRAVSSSGAVVGRAVVLRVGSDRGLVASRSDVEEALACVLRAVAADTLAVEARGGRDGAAPLVVRIEDAGDGCAIVVESPVPLTDDASLQSALAPRLRVQAGKVVRLDASLALACALLERNGIDVWVEARSDGGANIVISATELAVGSRQSRGAETRAL